MESHTSIEKESSQVSMAGEGEHTLCDAGIGLIGSCPVILNGNPRLDPMSIECSISPTAVCSQPSYNDNILGSSSVSSRGAKTKKPRGRPKKLALSLPDPICVPSTASKSCGEAIETWNLAKALGIKADDDGAVLSALRKSNRILAMEARIPVLG
ncbi:unnamed protein product [Amaranthus hypochondriacus]